MTRQQRLNQLLELLSAHGSLTIGDVVGSLGVSEATARRDIGTLATQRLLVRTHGGAAALGSAFELPLKYKIARQADAKLAIAQVASEMLRAGESVAINGGTTTTEVARAIGRRPDLDADASITIVTNALNIAYEVSIRPNVAIVVPGGTARSQSYELVGPLSDGVLDRINIDTAIIGVDGISADGGLTTIHPAEAKVSADFVAAAARVMVVADATKIGQRTFARIAALEAVDVFVTDADVPEPLSGALSAAGVKVVVAPAA